MKSSLKCARLLQLTLLSSSLMLCLSTSPAAAQIFGSPGLHAMKLLTAQTGWTSTGHQLFWTTDAGQDWKDITPSLLPLEKITSVFFVDTATGWVLSSRYDDNAEDWRFDLAATTNAGASWSSTKVNTSGLTPKEATLSGPADMFFLDAKHGWINLSVTSSAAAHSGAPLVTSDGGETWTWVPMGPGTAGGIFFNTLNDGWVLAPEGEELYVTHDGSHSWKQVSLSLPAEISVPNAIPSYDHLPVFDDSKHGYLSVSYSNGTTGTWVQFVTDDDGYTWRFYRILPVLNEVSYTILQGTWIAASLSKDQVLSTVVLAPGANANQVVTVTANVGKFTGLDRLGGSEGELSFADSSHGWVLAGDLLSTSDGGVTWTDITPMSAQPRPGSPSAGPSPNRKTASGKLSHNRRTPSSIPAVNTRVGFDRDFVLCTGGATCNTQSSIGYMQTWWASSPFFVTSLYLPGSSNKTTDPNLQGTNGPAWVSAVQQQGWGIIPTWVGKQPPCACKPGTGDDPNCTHFSDLIGPDVQSAHSQGTSEADAAMAAAATIGVGSSIIYKDLENYAPGTCGSVVNAFLSSWDQELHSGVYVAGAYGNPAPAADWWTNGQVSTKPDDVWIAKHDGRATIWGLNYGLQDTYWASNQRIHQFYEIPKNPGVSYGGTPAFNVDDDTMSAVVSGASVSKSYNFGTPQTLSYAPSGINDQLQTVGFNGTNGLWCQGGNCYVVDCGFDYTAPYSINDQGLIVGSVWNPGQYSQGFLYDVGTGSCTIINSPGAQDTWLTGINDDSLIVGNADTTDSEWAFIYNGTTFTTLSFPGGEITQATGINGDDLVTGTYWASNGQEEEEYGFVYLGGIYTSFLPPNAYTDTAAGINNNGQVTGAFYSPDTCGAFIYDMNNSTYMQFSVEQTCHEGTWPTGINDATAMVGNFPMYWLAVPQ